MRLIFCRNLALTESAKEGRQNYTSNSKAISFFILGNPKVLRRHIDQRKSYVRIIHKWLTKQQTQLSEGLDSTGRISGGSHLCNSLTGSIFWCMHGKRRNIKEEVVIQPQRWAKRATPPRFSLLTKVGFGSHWTQKLTKIIFRLSLIILYRHIILL